MVGGGAALLGSGGLKRGTECYWCSYLWLCGRLEFFFVVWM